MEETKMLKLNSVTGGYGSKSIIHNVDLKVDPGEIVSLIGPNGAGKSTIIKTIFGVADHHFGSIIYSGNEIHGLKAHELLLRNICYLPQGRVVFDRLTVLENLDLALGKCEPSYRKEVFDEALSHFPDLKSRLKTLAYSLSGGQRQMLAICMALVRKPRLILMDEPSLGLSPILQDKLFSLISDLKKQGISFLIVEQNAHKAIAISDRTYLLEQGRIALSGNRELLKHPKIKSVYLGKGV